MAAGYADGSVQIYDLKSSEVISIFSGHRTEVTCLTYDRFGHKLASGSKVFKKMYVTQVVTQVQNSFIGY